MSKVENRKTHHENTKNPTFFFGTFLFGFSVHKAYLSVRALLNPGWGYIPRPLGRSK